MGHVMRKEDDAPVKRAWDLEEDCISGKGRLKLTWKRCGEERK